MNELKFTISKYLKDLGVPASLSGYEYLREGIQLIIKDKSYLKGIFKKLYPTIATQFDTTTARVERAIRTAIEKSMLQGDRDLIQEIFGSTINAEKGKVTNAEFIATLADYISMKEGAEE
jgi:two-component system response regulator (stage 0 sporulation protein A)